MTHLDDSLVDKVEHSGPSLSETNEATFHRRQLETGPRKIEPLFQDPTDRFPGHGSM